MIQSQSAVTVMGIDDAFFNTSTLTNDYTKNIYATSLSVDGTASGSSVLNNNNQVLTNSATG